MFSEACFLAQVADMSEQADLERAKQASIDELPPHLLRHLNIADLGRHSSHSRAHWTPGQPSSSSGAHGDVVVKLAQGSSSSSAQPAQFDDSATAAVQTAFQASSSSVVQPAEVDEAATTSVQAEAHSTTEIDAGAHDEELVFHNPGRGMPLAVRVRQDQACAGRGKRRLIRQLVPPRKGKRRQHGGLDEGGDGDEEAEVAGIALGDEGDAGAPAYKSILYTHPRQESPGRKRGRRVGHGFKPKKDRDVSLWNLSTMSETDLFEMCVSYDYLEDRRLEPCPKCGQHSIEVRDRPEEGAMYHCPRRGCRHKESLTGREPGFFLERISLRKQMMVVYLMIRYQQPSVERLAADVDLDVHTVAKLVYQIRCVVSWSMVRANAILQVGGADEDVEADEMCFRSVQAQRGEEARCVWHRFIGVARRGRALGRI